MKRYKIIFFLVVLATFETSNSYANNCIPFGPQHEKDMVLTLCDNDVPKRVWEIQPIEAKWPADWQLSHLRNFQVRSCGRQNCNNPTRFTLRSYGVTLRFGNSAVPLTVSVHQNTNGASVLFPVESKCESGFSNCPFEGAERTTSLPTDQMQLRLSADLKSLLYNGTLTQPGLHIGTLTLKVDQA